VITLIVFNRPIAIYLPLYVLVCLFMTFSFSGCSTKHYRTDPNLLGYTEQGTASFYAMKFLFRKTASGERFNQLALTAAHRTLPFGTKVRVTNLSNNKSVVVRINDRGPFVKGRFIDLTRYAFSKIADTDLGLITVKIEVII
jgi:rare lipoprotein A